MSNFPSGLSFLETIAGYAQHIAVGEEPSANMPIRLAVIDPAYVASSYPGTLPKVQFEGEDTVTDKRYVVVARDYMPGAGDRVVMLPVGHTYVILGCISPAFQPNLQRADLARRVFLEGGATVGVSAGGDYFTQSVSFGYTFGAAPRVTVGAKQANGGAKAIVMGVTAVSTTGFTAYARSSDNVNFSGSANYDLDWIAIGIPG